MKARCFSLTGGILVRPSAHRIKDDGFRLALLQRRHAPLKRNDGVDGEPQPLILLLDRIHEILDDLKRPALINMGSGNDTGRYGRLCGAAHAASGGLSSAGRPRRRCRTGARSPSEDSTASGTRPIFARSIGSARLGIADAIGEGAFCSVIRSA